MASAYSFTEPTTSSLLLLAAYLLLLNLADLVAQWALAAGLLGPIFIGIVFGAPLAGWLSEGWMGTFEVVGYLGLMVLVFEGGLTTQIRTLVPLLPLALLVAATGLLLPIGLSLAILSPAPSFAFPPLHAFAAGSALSSTSLGTSLAVLKTSGAGLSGDIRTSALGTLLLAAAVMDDVVAFILARVLTVLGGGGGAVGPEIGRILGATIGLGVVLALVTRFIGRPAVRAGRRWLIDHPRVYRPLSSRTIAFAADVLGFMGVVAAAGYAGTSVLYGAFIAGLALADLDDCVAEQEERGVRDAANGGNHKLADLADIDITQVGTASSTTALRRARTLPAPLNSPSPLAAHHHLLPPTAPPPPSRPCASAFDALIAPVLNRLLLPIFFGSIGAAIPFLDLWKGGNLWRGVVYALPMALGKVATGLWVLVVPRPGMRALVREQEPAPDEAGEEGSQASTPSGASATKQERKRGSTLAERIPPAALLGLAMVARGEIGLLISQIARNASEPQLSESEFIIATWAIVLCTIAGPIGVGIVVRRLADRVMGGGWG